MLSRSCPENAVGSFTGAERPRAVPLLFRLYVLANGLLFYCPGRTVGFLKGRTESFQTGRAIRVALSRPGFGNLSCTHASESAGGTYGSDQIATGRPFVTHSSEPWSPQLHGRTLSINHPQRKAGKPTLSSVLPLIFVGSQMPRRECDPKGLRLGYQVGFDSFSRGLYE